MATTKAVAQAPASQLPEVIQSINNDYKAQIGHVFVVHGNIYDYIDNAGSDSNIKDVLTLAYDDNEARVHTGTPTTAAETGLTSANNKNSDKARIMAFFNISQGLVFPNESSKSLWKQAHQSILGDNIDEIYPGWDRPQNAGMFVACMNRWFDVSKRMHLRNLKSASENKALTKELIFTIVITDADSFVPRGEIAALNADRTAIVAVRNWAKDVVIGAKNRIILMTRHASDINESIKAELAVTHLVKKPSLADRIAWLNNFDAGIKAKATANRAHSISGRKVLCVNYADGFSAEQFAIQSAGMNRQQLKDVIMDSWMLDEPIDFLKVSMRKQRALEEEYAGMLDFKEPLFGFDQIGGHELFKTYCRRKIINPLRTGNAKLCSAGVLLPGPPGVGKSVAAWALAKEAGLNYLEIDPGKVFGGIVGQSEKNVRKLVEGIEAAAPCIVFIDEIDMAFGGGREGGGDSGTTQRVFRTLMTWLSNPSRRGQVVVVAATNRPDLLDAAFIRSGRFDAKIPFLPAGKGDVKGRKEILAALKLKNELVYSEELAPTENNPKSGFGRLLMDEDRYWTGAEIEVLLKEAYDNAYFANRKKKDGSPNYAIKIDDFNAAFDSIIPNTDEVERQIKLALLYSDHMTYVPPEYQGLARNKKLLKAELGLGDN